MDPFQTVNRLSIPSMVFGAATLVLAWLIMATSEPILQLQIGEVAVVTLSLFFYSLASDRISMVEENMKILFQGKSQAKDRLVP